MKDLPDDLAVMGRAELSEQRALRDDELAPLFQRAQERGSRARRELIPFRGSAERETSRHLGVLVSEGGMTGVWVSAALLFGLVVVLLLVAMRS